MCVFLCVARKYVKLCRLVFRFEINVIIIFKSEKRVLYQIFKVYSLSFIHFMLKDYTLKHKGPVD